jgi:hypothetical protein
MQTYFIHTYAGWSKENVPTETLGQGQPARTVPALATMGTSLNHDNTAHFLIHSMAATLPGEHARVHVAFGVKCVLLGVTTPHYIDLTQEVPRSRIGISHDVIPIGHATWCGNYALNHVLPMFTIREEFRGDVSSVVSRLLFWASL